jgi:hypothetical protein
VPPLETASSIKTSPDAMSRLGRRVDRFFFRPTTSFDLGICRILFFLCVLIFNMPRNVESWGNVSRLFWRPVWLFKVFHLPLFTSAHLRIFVMAWGISLALSCVGLFTRASTIFALVMGTYLLGLPHNFGKVSHGDPILIFTMLIFAISRCGDGFSIDALIRKYRRKPKPRRSGEYTWPIRMAWIMLSIVFCAAGATKLIRSGTAWVTSDNLQMLLLQHYFTLTNPPTQIGLLIARHPMLCHVLAAMTIVVELSFPLSLFSRRLRRVLVPAAFFMQVGIGIAMGVYFTQFMISYLFWIPWRRIARFFRKWKVFRIARVGR